MKRHRFPSCWPASDFSRCRALSIVALAVMTAGVASGQAPARASLIVLTRVTVVDPVQDVPLRDATIVVEGSRIVALGSRGAVPIPRGATVIDASGLYVIPGLWDMHAHMAQPLAPDVELEANAGYFLPLFVAYGVIGVRDMAGDLATLRRWRDEIAGGTRVGPRLIITGEKVGKGPVVPGAPFPVRTRRDIERSVRALWDSGAAFVKVDAVPPTLFRELTREAWALGFRVAGHVETPSSVREMAREGLRSVEHLDGIMLAANRDEDAVRRALMQSERPTIVHRILVKLGVRTGIASREAVLLEGYNAARADSLFDLFKQTGTWNCPTLRLLGAAYHQTDGNFRLPPDSLLLREVTSPHNGFAYAPFEATNPLSAVYPRLEDIVRAMSARGAGVLAGTDTPGLFAVPGRSLHEELGLLVRAGLTPRAALRAATTGPADFLEVRDSLGTIRVGAYADLVLLEADPLADIANTQRIRAVMARGRYLDRAALDRMIGDAARVARRVRAAAP